MSFWDQFELDPRDRGHAHLRASDRDRELVASQLAAAYADGRLTSTEFDERSSAVQQARLLPELVPLVRDLVRDPTMARTPAVDVRTQAERQYRADKRQALRYLTPALICWIIWAAVLAGGQGTWFPWPVFVMIGTGMRYMILVMNPQDHIAQREQRILERQRRAQRRALRRGDLAE